MYKYVIVLRNKIIFQNFIKKDKYDYNAYDIHDFLG